MACIWQRKELRDVSAIISFTPTQLLTYCRNTMHRVYPPWNLTLFPLEPYDQSLTGRSQQPKRRAGSCSKSLLASSSCQKDSLGVMGILPEVSGTAPRSAWGYLQPCQAAFPHRIDGNVYFHFTEELKDHWAQPLKTWPPPLPHCWSWYCGHRAAGTEPWELRPRNHR